MKNLIFLSIKCNFFNIYTFLFIRIIFCDKMFMGGRMVNNKKIKQSKLVSDDVVRVRNLLILLVSVVIICVGLFFLTEKMIEKDNNENETKEEVKIDYDIATIGTMFNRPEKEYFVLIYSNEENSNDLGSVLDSYRSSDNYVKTYYIDLDLKVNSIAKGKEDSKKPSNSNEVIVTGATLYKIKDGKVANSYFGVDSIKSILK